MKVYSVTTEDQVEFANAVKELVFQALSDDRKLAEGVTIQELCSNYVVVMRRPGLFGKVWDKLFPHQGELTLHVLKKV